MRADGPVADAVAQYNADQKQKVTEAGPLVVLLGDGRLPDDLERAVGLPRHRGARGPRTHPGRRARRAAHCASWPGPLTTVRWPWSTPVP